ncbi:hypothetical protein BCR44DRAFT_1436685 [Catenaria anguillulae PL171]|uniref:Uncharacterized protein n=1 Tax=Catenaria anguillulae PL171 TaxID=765915 RepID=A0A1Y2HHT1_9FUNG|nr:hypothetical protein BCR44DRAFT_1436685 [Catenaria anguillulae PL171]
MLASELLDAFPPHLALSRFSRAETYWLWLSRPSRRLAIVVCLAKCRRGAACETKCSSGSKLEFLLDRARLRWPAGPTHYAKFGTTPDDCPRCLSIVSLFLARDLSRPHSRTRTARR